MEYIDFDEDVKSHDQCSYEERSRISEATLREIGALGADYANMEIRTKSLLDAIGWCGGSAIELAAHLGLS